MAPSTRGDSPMPLHTRKLAWAATGVFAVGAVTGLAAPSFLRAASAPAQTSASPSTAAQGSPHGPIPFGQAPNYRAIVAQNQAAVVGITIAGEMKVAAHGRGGMQPFGGGDDDDNPFSQFFRQMPNAPRGSVPVHAQGSGFIISPD